MAMDTKNGFSRRFPIESRVKHSEDELIEFAEVNWEHTKSFVNNRLSDFESKTLVRLVKALKDDFDKHNKSLELVYAKNVEEIKKHYEEKLQTVLQSHDSLLGQVKALDFLCSQHMKHLVKTAGLQMDSMRNSQGEALNKVLEFLKAFPVPQVNNQVNIPEHPMTLKMEQQPVNVHVEKQDPTPLSVNIPPEAIRVMLEQQPAPQVTIEGAQVLIPPEAIKMQVENLDALLKSQEASLEQIKSMVAAMLMPRVKEISYNEFGAPVSISEKSLEATGAK